MLNLIKIFIGLSFIILLIIASLNWKKDYSFAQDCYINKIDTKECRQAVFEMLGR